MKSNTLKNVVLFLCLKLITVYCIGQTSVEYIIKHDGTQIKGTIKNQENYFEVVDFKKTAHNEFVRYTPKDIKGFSKNNFTFHSISSSSISGFYRLMSAGAINLYQGNSGKNYIEYIAVKDNEAYLLSQSQKIENNVIKKTPQYLRNLKLITQDQPDIIRRIDKMNFSGSELQKLIDNYNKQSGNYDSTLKTKKQFIKPRLSIYGQVHSVGVVQRVNPTFGNINFGGGINYNIFINYNFYLSAGAAYSLLKEEIRSATFNASILQFPVEANYLVGNSSIRPKFFVGFGFNRLITNDPLLVDKTGISVKAGIGIEINQRIQTNINVTHSTFGFGNKRARRETYWRPITITVGYFL